MKKRTLITLCLTAALSARAALIVNITEDGNDVVVSGAGTLDLTDLTLSPQASTRPLINPGASFLLFGTDSNLNNHILTDRYTAISGPNNFGSISDFTAPSSGEGTTDPFGIYGASGQNILYVPDGYVSGTALAGTNRYANTSFADLGLTYGSSHTWTWGSGAHEDSFSIHIAPIPEPSSGLLVLVGGAGMLYIRRRRQDSLRVFEADGRERSKSFAPFV